MRIKSVAMFMVVVAVFLAAMAPAPAPCQTAGSKAGGGKIYLPIYHSVFIGQSKMDYYLTVTMIFHNIDETKPVTVISIKAYNQEGHFERELVQEPLVLGPLAIWRWLLPQGEFKGKAASAASLIIQWQGAPGTRLPLVQAMMVGTRSTLGLSYMTTGFPLK